MIYHCKKDASTASKKKSKSIRKARPEIIHIRKPSLSHSVSSADSAASTTSNFNSIHGQDHDAHTHHSHAAIDYDPLHLHPTFAAPPRLRDRPFIVFPDEESPEALDGMEDDEQVLEEYHRVAVESTSSKGDKETMILPLSSDSPTPQQEQLQQASAPNPSRPYNDEGGDYFMYKLNLLRQQERQQRAALGFDEEAVEEEDDKLSRPSLPRSRWSESTIATMDVDSSAIEEEDEEEEEEAGNEEVKSFFDLDDDDDDDATSDNESVLEMAFPSRDGQVNKAKSWQNFSHKRDIVMPSSPRRPPMKTMDSVETFIKRGGWKRRGIVFNKEEGDEGVF